MKDSYFNLMYFNFNLFNITHNEFTGDTGWIGFDICKIETGVSIKIRSIYIDCFDFLSDGRSLFGVCKDEGYWFIDLFWFRTTITPRDELED